MRNNLWWTFTLTLLVVTGLTGLYYLPYIKIFDIELRHVNLLCDVQYINEKKEIQTEVNHDTEDSIKLKMDSLTIRAQRAAYLDSIPNGMTAIEDFADTSGVNREMDIFYSALDKVRERPVRIAYFGDSYIEGDILTMDLRGMLQQRYGGCGAGFVEIECVTSGFRQTVVTKRSGWNCYHANEVGRGFTSSLQGIAGSYFVPMSSASYEVRGTKSIYANQLDTAEVVTVYFTSGDGLRVSYALNGGVSQSLFSSDMIVEPEIYEETTDTCEADTFLCNNKAIMQKQQGAQAERNTFIAKSINGRIGRFSMKVLGGGSSRFYGIALDGHQGISVDNFSMRGSSGLHLDNIPQETLRRFAAKRPYDLIILHYGLNVASPQQKNYSGYATRMGKIIRRLKEANPNASILVVGISDRDVRNFDGEMHTMDGVRELLSYQRQMASDQHIAFWNLYEAMGGDGSLAKMKEKRQANTDYAHINAAGGRQLARLLFDVLINGKENYDKRIIH